MPYTGRYKPVRLHAIRNDKFIEQLGFVSKNSTSWGFLSELRDAGYRAADAWVSRYLGNVGKRSSLNVKAELTGVVLNAPVR